MKRYLSIWVHGYLTRARWNIATSNERILKQSNSVRHDGVAEWKHAKKSLGKFWYKKSLLVSWSLCSIVDVLKNFHNNCTDIYELNPVVFFVRYMISMANMFKKSRNRTEVIDPCPYLLMLQKGITGEKSLAIHWYTKASNNYIKNSVLYFFQISFFLYLMCLNLILYKKRLWRNERFGISHVLGRKQSLWLIILTKVTCKVIDFYQERSYTSIWTLE